MVRVTVNPASHPFARPVVPRIVRGLLAVAGAVFVLSIPRTAAAGFVPAGPAPSSVDEGELLLGELNCVACHQPPEGNAARFAPRGAPVLGSGGLRLESEWLRAWLANPAATKPGTAMPDALNGLDGAARAEAVDALVHYLAANQPPGAPTYLGADSARVALGRARFHALGCVACHVPTERGEVPEEAWEKARANGAPLAGLARKYPGGELVGFLKNPVAHRPGGRMPSMNLTDAEALAIATYLLADQTPGLADPARAMATIPGVSWEYYEGSFGRTADLDKAKPVASGEAAEIGTAVAKRPNEFGLKFSGAIMAPKEGEYTFWLGSDDGATLDIDGTRVVDNDGVHPPSQRSGKARLSGGPHSFELRFFQGGGGMELSLAWAGPGFGRKPIGGASLQHYGQPMLPVGHKDLAVDSTKVEAGRAWFAKQNCAACHATAPGQPTAPAAAAPALAKLRGRGDAGCLAVDPRPGLPRYDLSPAQRTALRRALERADQFAQPLAPERQVAATLARFNCYGCHVRDEFGGPAATGKDGWFSVLGEADLGEEGKLPPHLNGVGAKLKPKWLETVLGDGAKVRPYMATRMPVFGSQNVGHLPALLAAVDRKTPLPAEPTATARDAKYGRKLVGNEGLSCVACHTFSTFGSMGIPALGLERMHERLEWDWFRRYLPDPAALRPGTRMPSFWPDGHAVNTDILGGQTDAQIQAIWAWLGGGAKADIPAGLVRARQEIVVDKEAVIYRHFIEGAGSRAIGVGYPEHANIAFDANQMRLALIWQGGFIDRSRHSTDRGTGYEPPLGDHVARLPEGAPFAVLAASDTPWPAAAKRSPGYRFLGYSLDEVRRPAFRYEFEGIAVEDSIVPRTADIDVTLVRTLKFGPGKPAGTVWFRAAVGAIREQADGSFLVDDKLRFRFRGSRATVVGNELRVPVAVPGELVEEITW